MMMQVQCMILGRVATPTQPLAGAEDALSGDARIV